MLISKWLWRNHAHNAGKPPQQYASDPNNHQKSSYPHSDERDASDTDSAPAPTSNDKHEAAERIFWCKQMRLAWWLNMITAVAAGVGLAGLFFIFLGIRHADDATIEANRAWVAVDHVHFVNPQISYLTLEVEMKNVGHEPAIEVAAVKPLITFIDLNASNGSVNRIKWPKIDTCAATAGMNGGMVIYQSPAIGITETYGFSVTPEMSTNLQGVIDGREAFLVIGCIGYSTFKKRHFTQYCYISHKTPVGNVFTQCELGQYAD